jgi:hypothetical protein
VILQRITKTPKMFMVTGVMAPEDQSYYSSGQVTGLIGGLKGVVDLETLMQTGGEGVPGFPGMQNAGRGTRYYLPLHACLTLLILAVVIGNVGMFLSRKKGQK